MYFSFFCEPVMAENMVCGGPQAVLAIPANLPKGDSRVPPAQAGKQEHIHWEKMKKTVAGGHKSPVQQSLFVYPEKI